MSLPQPGLWPGVLLQRTLEPALDKTLEEGQVFTGALSTQSPTCAWEEYTCSTASVLVHAQVKPGPQFTISLGHGWGAKQRRSFSSGS